MPNFLNWVADKFSKDPSKMLIVTGAAGYLFSSVAQILAIVTNNKISPKEKGFLIPQEGIDACTNVLTFLAITTGSKFAVKKMFTTGKFASKGVREYINKTPSIKKDIGKYDLNLDKFIKKGAEGISDNLAEEYSATKNFATTMTTVGATILSSNIITPLVRNRGAASAQKKQIESVRKPADGEVKADPTKAIKILNRLIYSQSGGSMKI